MGYFAKYETNCEFMNNREKGNLADVAGHELHIADYKIMKGERGEYVTLIFKEIDGFFYFGSSLLLDIIKGAETDGQQALLFSTPVKVEKRQNKTGTFDYWKWTFIED